MSDFTPSPSAPTPESSPTPTPSPPSTSSSPPESSPTPESSSAPAPSDLEKIYGKIVEVAQKAAAFPVLNQVVNELRSLADTALGHSRKE